MRRVIFYLFFDATGQVDDFVTYKLRALRAHAEHIFVVSNSPLDDTGRARLHEVADTVWERANVGFDVYAYRDAMRHHGLERLAEVDEILLMNCTFFGPIGSFDPLFAEMDADESLDFWAISDHGPVEPHPFVLADRMEAHLQSHWISVRASMHRSQAWADYWEQMPPINTYTDSVVLHEGRFTQYFHDAGFASRVAYPAENYSSLHPLAENTEEVLLDGCPIVKRRSFFSDPLYLDRRAIDTRAIVRRVEQLGYPVDLLYANLARTSVPRILATNLGLLEVLPDLPPLSSGALEPRTTALVHVDAPELLDGLLDAVDRLPTSRRLVVTVTPEADSAVRATLARRDLLADVRVVDARGGHIAALLVGCRDVLTDDDVDLVVRLHTLTKPEDDDPNRADLQRRHLVDNLVASADYAAQVIGLFERHATLGMVMPPAMHIGFPTLGHGWQDLEGTARAVATRCGIAVPFDADTPWAAYGGMFVARPVALRRLAEQEWTADDFDRTAKPRGPRLAGALERLLTYASLSEGLHVREVLHPELAAVDYSQLEYKYQVLAARLPPRPEAQLGQLDRLKHDARAARRAAATPQQPVSAGSRPREAATIAARRLRALAQRAAARRPRR